MLELLAHNSYIFFGVVFVITILSGSFGVGGFVLIPLGAIAYGAKVGVGIITLYFLFQNISKIVLFRKHIDWNIAVKMVIWSIPGAIVGSFALSVIPMGIFNKMLAAFILVYLANDMFELVPKKHYNAGMIPVFGILYGLTSGLTGSGNLVKGPLFTSIGLLKERYIGTYAVTSFFVNVPKIIVYGFTGIITIESLRISLPFLIISIVGTYIGMHLLKHVREDIFFYALNIVFAISAIILFFQ